ncbi:MAG: 16S rRNA (cytosine(1402)-N(4))-methyltransferase RsmH [Clostridia bacterium]|nr:16S rRNA (cytosine(1402)-N(4))-methyltransferase RsmH [Clostridia bacterium]
MDFVHYSVMKEECLESLKLSGDGIYFDGTLGGAGHSYEILKRTAPNGRLIATDLDGDAIENAKSKLKEFEGRFSLYNTNFKNFNLVLEQYGVSQIDGALLDLGVSSYQLDNRERGFSYMSQDVRLDMRMDQTSGKSAWEVVNLYEKSKLSYIFSVYGEEKFADNIAKNICEERKIKPIDTTGELVRIIDKSIPYKFKQNGHPAKKVFQAIRIEVNEELDGLSDCLKDIVKKLKKGGRLVVLTFHSLEDRIVKQTFKDLETDCVCDKRFPICVCGKKKEIKLVTKKPIEASEQECKENSRSHSAKLRIIEKI